MPLPSGQCPPRDAWQRQAGRKEGGSEEGTGEVINCCHRRSKAQSPPSLFTLGQLLLHPPVLTQAVLHNDDRSSSNNTTITPPAT